jgi:hypothetical protein
MSSVSRIPSSTIPIPGLDHTDQNTFDMLWMQYRSKFNRNQLRSEYYAAKNGVKSLNIAIPPKILENVETVMGWPAKAVDTMARRCNLDGFKVPGLSSDDLGIDAIWDDNNLTVMAQQSTVSALKHAIAFIATTAGDVESGEPDVLISARSANTATGLWSMRRHQLAASLAIVDYDTEGPLEFAMYLPDRVLIMRRVGRNWRVDTVTHSLGRVPVQMLTYRPDLDRPFGSSRISRPVMSLTDEAIRTVVRGEISAEFFMAPQRYVLGADPDAFSGQTGWEAITGRLLGLSRDEDGDLPTVGQFPQISMQPYSEQLRGIAMRFSSETGIPLNSLGVIQDNPPSAEAMDAAERDLVIESDAAKTVFGVAWKRAMLTALQIRDGLDEIPDELRKLTPDWRPSHLPTQASAADAITKMVTAFPWLAESEVALEMCGWDRDTIDRAMADKRRAAGSGVLDKLAAAASQVAQPPAPATDGNLEPV